MSGLSALSVKQSVSKSPVPEVDLAESKNSPRIDPALFVHDYFDVARAPAPVPVHAPDSVSAPRANIHALVRSSSAANLYSPQVSSRDIKNNTWHEKAYAALLNALLFNSITDQSFVVSQWPVTDAPSTHLRSIACRMLAELRGVNIGDHVPKQTAAARYTAFLSAFRELADAVNQIENPDPSKPKEASKDSNDTEALALICVNLLSEVARRFYTAWYGLDYGRDLVDAVRAFAPLHTVENQAHRPFDHVMHLLQDTYDNVHATRSVLGGNGLLMLASTFMSDELGLFFDPVMQGNLPYVLFHTRYKTIHGAAREAKCIRMCTPTVQARPVSPRLSPEFEYFLLSQNIDDPHEPEHHVYFNRQNPDHFAEGPRTQLLQSLNESAKWNKRITVVSLPATGHAYDQTGIYKSTKTFAHWREQLTASMRDNAHGFYFPARIREAYGSEHGFKVCMAHLLNELRDKSHLTDETVLSSSDRRALVFHFLNVALVRELLAVTNATTYDNECKQGIDRGGMANAYMLAMQSMPDQQADNAVWEKFARDVAAAAFAPAILVKQREVVAQRFYEFMNALRWWNRTHMSSK